MKRKFQPASSGRHLSKSALTFVFIAGFLLALAGCGGGGGDAGGGGTPPAPTYSVSGTISAPSGIAIDSDVNDPNENYTANDSIGSAQSMANPISLAGYVNVAGAGADGRSKTNGDDNDYFRVTLNSGDRIFLAIGDYEAGDLDLYLFNEGGGTSIASSIGTGRSELITAPSSGTFIVNIEADSGASNYILTIGPTVSGASVDALSTEDDFVCGEAIVRFKESPALSASQKTLAHRASSFGMNMKAGGPGRPVLLSFNDEQKNSVFQALSVSADKTQARTADLAKQCKMDTLRVIKALRARSDVATAEPNYLVKSFATPNDTNYGLQWHYRTINLPQAWDITQGSDNVIVAVIDTGVLMNHPDLQGRLTSTGYDFISDDARSGDGTPGIDPNPDDPGDRLNESTTSSFHGTHCAGTVAASTNNARGVAGAGWNTKIMPIRVLGKGGGTTYDIIQGVLYAAREPNDSETLPAQAAAIISMSLGGSGSSTSFQTAINTVRSKGVIVIAAAGNAATSTPSYPASYDGVISVSAVNINSTLASYSNYGQYIDVAAPGGDSGDQDGDGYADKVWSTCGTDASGSIVFNYMAYQGTSMATPHVAGVVALMKALRPSLTPAQLDGYLQGGQITSDIGTAGWDNKYGWGLIDAYKAVRVAQDNPIITATLRVSPNDLNFGLAASTLTLNVSKAGDGVLSVSSVTPQTGTWLQVSESTVDASKFGTYTVQVNRSHASLASTGVYSDNIIITPSSGSAFTIPVHVQVNNTAGSPDAGYHYVLLIKADTFEVLRQFDVEAASGTYSYAFTGVPAGTYYVFAGSDRDNDSYIDNDGESFGAYDDPTQVTPLVVDANKSGVNFATDLILFLPTATSLIDSGGQVRLKRIR